MFSGLTNQVSSWMGQAKGEPQDEEVPTPTKDALDSGAATEGEKTQSPTKAGSKLDMFTNVKSQMTGWLGSGIPIPGLRKTDPGAAGADAPPAEGVEVQPETSTAAQETAKDEDDNSSATGGADSGPASPTGTPTEEQAGQIGNVTHKAVAGAKSFGSFLYSAVNKAGAKVSEAGAKIKKTVEENSLLGEFNKEQDAFIRGQAGGKGPAELPWAGRDDEAALKEECLSLSTDRRNFVRAPPAGVEFNFDYDTSYPVAVAIMAEDPNLEKMRYDLVPIAITEENFWRNYFYRVSLICQFIEASEENNESLPASRLTSVDEPQETAINSRLTEEGVVTVAPAAVLHDVKEKTSEAVDPAVNMKKSSSDNILRETDPAMSVAKAKSENLIDTMCESDDTTDNIGKGIKGLSIDKNNQEEEEWETELEAELRDYEVLSGDKASVADDKHWEKECHDLLGDEDEDLK